MKSDSISIIIPVYNEEKYLAETIRSLSLTGNEELIVVDGGSTDKTLEIARRFADKVDQVRTGRGKVMNHGAKMAEGEILVFLHADCRLPENALYKIRNALADEETSACGFYISIDHPSAAFRVIEAAANIRHRLTSFIYGDQAMSMTKATFHSVGGFADIPIMEDIDISMKLKKIGKIKFLRPPIKVSPRRWLNEGILYTTLRDWSIAFSYTFLKASPDRLIKFYREIR